MASGEERLIVLPSSEQAKAFVEATGRTRSIRVVADRDEVKVHWPALLPFTCSPEQLWQEAMAWPRLLVTVITFPDQLFGTGPGYEKVRVDGQDYWVSIIETQLAWKFRPTILTPAIEATEHESLSLSTLHIDPIGETLSKEQLRDLIRSIVGPSLRLSQAYASKHRLSVGMQLLTAKQRDNHHRAVCRAMGEAEGLLRLIDNEATDEEVQTILMDIQSAQRWLLSRIS